MAAEEMTEQDFQEIRAGREPIPIDSADAAPVRMPISERKIPSPPSAVPLATSAVEHEPGEQAATLYIPKLAQKFDVFWGTSDDVLSQGVGLYVSDVTVVPGSRGHTVMSGHRDTVFTELGDLKTGDRLHVAYGGELFEYEIFKIWITHKEDLTVITDKSEPILTLTTCYPFEFFGDAPDRYIIQAKLTGPL